MRREVVRACAVPIPPRTRPRRRRASRRSRSRSSGSRRSRAAKAMSPMPRPKRLPQLGERAELVQLAQAVEPVARGRARRDDEPGLLEIAEHPGRPAGAGGGVRDVERIHRRDLNKAVSSPRPGAARRAGRARPRRRPRRAGGSGCPPAARSPRAPRRACGPAGCEIRRRRSRSCVVRRRGEPLRVERRPALVAQRVVGGDRVRLDAREPERHPAGDAGAVAAARAMDRGRRLGVAEQRQRLRELRRGSGRRARGTPPASTASPRRRGSAADPSPGARPEPAAG